VAMLALVLFRRPNLELLRELPARTSKTAVTSFSIEFAKVPELATNWLAGNVDVLELSPANMFESNTHDLITQLSLAFVRTDEIARLDLNVRPAPDIPSNGRHERLHLTLKQKTTRPAAANLLQRAKFDAFLKEFNGKRRHEASR
jgi:hypothetical protein